MQKYVSFFKKRGSKFKSEIKNEKGHTLEEENMGVKLYGAKNKKNGKK